MWHASVTVWDPRSDRRMDQPRLAEREAVRLLAGVGGDHEWWIWSAGQVGHLRVPVTGQESTQIPPGCAVVDAGETGAQRLRTR